MYSAIQRQQMISVILESIQQGLSLGTRIKLDHQQYNQVLLQPAATFITLTLEGLLRGCIGSLAADKALIDDLAHNAFSAAFNDPRFSPLNWDEYPLLDIEISIIDNIEIINCNNEQQLAAELRPFVDGLIISDDEHIATFLPRVWQDINNPVEFIEELKQKAMITDNKWQNSTRAERFTVNSFHIPSTMLKAL